MRISVIPSAISRLAGAVGTVWLCGTGSAWAGGGMDAAFLQTALLEPLCALLGMTSCPQLPTIAQIVPETSALGNVAPNFVSSQIIPTLGTTSGTCDVAGNFGFVPCDTLAVNAVNPLAPSSIALSNLRPLAFVTSPGQAATPVALGTKGENSFFYAVLTGGSGQHTLDLFLDYPPWTTKQFVMGQVVATIQFPTVVLNNGSERPVAATLQLTATCNGAAACLSASVTGDFVTPGTQKTYTADQLGLQIGYSFGTSANSTTQHGTFEFQIPVVVTQSTDPAYFGTTPPGSTNGNTAGFLTFINQASGLPTAFSKDDLGFTPKFLGMPVGVAPYPAPLCTDATCPSPPPMVSPTTFYGFCASIAKTPAVAAFVSVGTDGTTYASSQVASPLPQCPAQSGTTGVSAR